MRRATVLLLIVSTLCFGLLAGCAASSPTPSPTAAPSPTPEPVTITMQIAEGMDDYNILAQNFMDEFPYITVKVDFMNIGEWQGILKTKLESKDAPDIFITGSPYEVEMYSAAGYLADLSGLSSVPRFKDGALYDGIFNGKVYSLPSQFTVVPVFYNKKIFAENNLSIPTDWDAFIDVCGKLAAKGIAPIAYGEKDGWPVAHFVSAVAPIVVQEKLVDKDWAAKRAKGEVKFATSPEWLDVFAKLKQLLDMGAFNEGMISMSHDESLQLIASGEAAMIINGTWILGGLLEVLPEGFELGAFPMPANKAGEALTAVNGKSNYQFCVWAESKNLEIAKKFLDYTLTAENNALFNKNKAPSPLKDAVVELHPAMTQYSELTEGLKYYTFPWDTWPKGLVSVMIKLMQEELMGTRTPQQVLEELDKAWDLAAAE